MADISSSVMVASMIVGILTVPAASQTIDASDSVSADLPNISDSESVPEQVSTETTSDSFSRTVETAFREFETVISQDSAETSLESPGSSLEIEKSPEKTTWTFESSLGRLVVERTPSRTVERVETPQGTLEKVQVDGGISRNFEGADREKVEETAEELRDLMEQKKKQIEQRREKTVAEQYERNLEIEIDAPEDFVIIENQGSSAVNLDGWKLSDEARSYKFESVSVPAEGKLYAYTDSEEELELEEKEEAEYVYNTDVVWNDDGDTATLSTNGEEVAVKSY